MVGNLLFGVVGHLLADNLKFGSNAKYKPSAVRIEESTSRTHRLDDFARRLLDLQRPAFIISNNLLNITKG